jgi:diguanylate cyclase (GGDEF)-like protein
MTVQQKPDVPVVDEKVGGGGWRSFAAHVFAPIKITRDQFVDLLVPFWHTVHIRRHAAALTISRVQLVAALFAVLVPVCSLLDWMVFPWPQWAMMTGLRVASALVFLALAWPWNGVKTRLRADAMLFVMLLVPPVFYILSIFVTQGIEFDSFGRMVLRLYALMPNVVLAGLAVFPLTALEVLVFSIPAFAFAVVGMILEGQVLSLEQHGPTLWLMVLVMGVAMFSGMSQMHYMAALVHRAMVDPLTGAYTRRSGAETLELQFRLAALQNAPVAVVFFDLDHFKSINDTYGHEEGDKALRALSTHLKDGLRRGDILVRWGGEEFVAILNNTDTEGARIGVQRLRAAGFGMRPDGTPLTASIGVAERKADGVLDWNSLIELADKRMYDAKKGGRNRAVMPDGEVLVFGENVD